MFFGWCPFAFDFKGLDLALMHVFEIIIIVLYRAKILYVFEFVIFFLVFLGSQKSAIRGDLLTIKIWSSRVKVILIVLSVAAVFFVMMLLNRWCCIFVSLTGILWLLGTAHQVGCDGGNAWDGGSGSLWYVVDRTEDGWATILTHLRKALDFQLFSFRLLTLMKSNSRWILEFPYDLIFEAYLFSLFANLLPVLFLIVDEEDPLLPHGLHRSLNIFVLQLLWVQTIIYEITDSISVFLRPIVVQELSANRRNFLRDLVWFKSL